jgi:hypothetical protein
VDGATIVLATAWWAPLAIVGGALLGALVAFVVLLWANAGAPQAPTPQAAEHGFVRVEGRSELRWNPWAFVTAAVLIGLIVGLSIALSVD